MRLPSPLIFEDRHDAGRALAQRLRVYARDPDVLVLALPRGGVPVGYEVARQLDVPLDVFLVRKLGVPGSEELAMGAIAAGGIRVINEDVVQSLGILPTAIERVAEREARELERRDLLYRGARPLPVVSGRIVILVDDGLATGSTMRAAVAALRQEQPSKIVVAVPIAAQESCRALRKQADEVICVATPAPFLGVGAWYRDFTQTSDEEVKELLSAQGLRRSG